MNHKKGGNDMKRFIFIAIFAFAALSLAAADIGNISVAFKSGKASALSGLMDTEVDMALPEATQKCTAGKAISLLEAFFGKNKPTGFNVVHHADKAENGFFVGKLPTTSKEYRVNVTYRTVNNKAIIQSIRIE